MAKSQPIKKDQYFNTCLYRTPYRFVVFQLKGITANVVRVQVFEVGLGHSDGYHHGEGGVVDEGAFAHAVDDVLVSVLIHPGDVPVAVGEVLDVGEPVHSHHLLLPFLVEGHSAEGAAQEGLGASDPVLDPSDGYLQVVHLAVLVVSRQIVCTEGAQQQSQEEVQDLAGGQGPGSSQPLGLHSIMMKTYPKAMATGYAACTTYTVTQAGQTSDRRDERMKNVPPGYLSP